MRRTQTVAALAQQGISLAVGQHLGHLIRRFVHRLPELQVLGRGLDRNERAANPILIHFRRAVVQFDEAVGVLRFHFADAANGDDDALVVCGFEGFQAVDVGHLLEQFGFRIGAACAQGRGGDLQVEMPHRAIPVRVPASDEQRRGLQFFAQGLRQRAARDADVQIGTQVSHQVFADQT